MATSNPEAIDLDFDEPRASTTTTATTTTTTTAAKTQGRTVVVEARKKRRRDAKVENKTADEDEGDEHEQQEGAEVGASQSEGDQDQDSEDDQDQESSDSDNSSEEESSGDEENTGAESAVKKETPQTPEAPALTPAQRKLQELRARMLKAQDENKKDVIEESKRLSDTPAARKERQKQAWRERQKTEQEEREKRGDMPLEMAQAMHETVEEKQLKEKKKKKKKKDPSHSYAIYNGEADYNRYKKRAKRVPYTKEEYEAMKKAYEEKGMTGMFYGDLQDNTNIGRFAVADDEFNKDLMAEELRIQETNRAAFSRRRPISERETVTYINERNRVFNKKASRAYDKYTVEIRQNLERGTAL